MKSASSLHRRSSPVADRINEVCRADCAAGDPDACYWIAIALEPTAPRADILPLFERSCRLGLASGCTNWAASHWSDEASRVPTRCLYRVFDHACDAGDWWGCGMMGRLLVEDLHEPLLGALVLDAACQRDGAAPCRFLAYYLEGERFGPVHRQRIEALMARACAGGDESACGAHATVDETFYQRDATP